MLGLIPGLPPYAVRAVDTVDKPLASIPSVTPGVHIGMTLLAGNGEPVEGLPITR